MSDIHFVIPQIHHKEIVLNYKQEHFDNQEFYLHGSSMIGNKHTYEEWLSVINQDKENLPKEWVTSSTYLAMNDMESMVIGMIDIRHELNEDLRAYGGHIGFGVRPSQRKRGYATKMLLLALEECEKLQIKEVMISCNKQNIGSKKTIIKCGGVIEEEFRHEDEIVQVYWIGV